MQLRPIIHALLAGSLLTSAAGQSALAADYPPPIQIEYGFTTDSSIALIDQLAEHQVGWVRIGVTPVVVHYQSPTSIAFNETDWQAAIDAAQHARAKGMKVYLNTHPAYELPKLGLSDADFQTAVSTQYQRLAAKFPQVEAWQVYNEANHAHKDDYKPVCERAEFQCSGGQPTVLPAAYMSQLYGSIAAARGAIKAANPNALVTTNAAGGNAYARQYMDQLSPLLDVHGFDIYPGEGDYPQGLSGYKSLLNTLKATYGPSLWLVETGQYNGSGGCAYGQSNAHVQGDRLRSTIAAAAETGIKHVFLYRQKDFTVPWLNIDNCELHFGLVDRLGRNKVSYQPVMEAVDLYAYMPLSGNTVATSRALATLHRGFRDSLGRPPTTWEVHNDGWLAATVAGRTYDQIVALNSNWLSSAAGASARRDSIIQSYWEALGRAPIEQEIQQWMSANVVAYHAVMTTHLNWLGTSAGQSEREAAIVRSIQNVLGYTPTAQEVAGWMAGPPVTYQALIEQHRNWADYHQP